jgi:integrase
MKYNVNFKLEKRKDSEGVIIDNNVPLFADITYSGTRFFYFTGYRIGASNWKQGDKKQPTSEDQTAIKNTFASEGTRKVSASEVNRRLRLIKAALTNIFDNTQIAPLKNEIVKVLDEACKKAIPESIEPEPEKSDFFTMFDKFLKVREFSYDRTKHFKSVFNQWKRYEEKRKIKITFDFVTVDVLRDFEKYLKEESTKPKATRKPEKQVISPKGKNTIHKIIAMTRAFWNFAKKDLKQQGIDINYPFGKDGYQVPGDTYGAPIYITKEERKTLYNAVLDSERLQRVRDIFVFQCLIGARVGDLCKLTKANIQNGILSYIPRKTKDGKPVAVTVPLSKNALEILSRYDFPDGRLLPFITDQRYNTYLKELFRKVEINRTVTRLNPTTGEPEQVKLSDIASSHMARRAFIGNLYGKVDSGIISSMSGHIQGSKAFTRYYDVSTELQQQAINLID